MTEHESTLDPEEVAQPERKIPPKTLDQIIENYKKTFKEAVLSGARERGRGRLEAVKIIGIQRYRELKDTAENDEALVNKLVEELSKKYDVNEKMEKFRENLEKGEVYTVAQAQRLTGVMGLGPGWPILAIHPTGCKRVVNPFSHSDGFSGGKGVVTDHGKEVGEDSLNGWSKNQYVREGGDELVIREHRSFNDTTGAPTRTVTVRVPKYGWELPCPNGHSFEEQKGSSYKGEWSITVCTRCGCSLPGSLK